MRCALRPCVSRLSAGPSGRRRGAGWKVSSAARRRVRWWMSSRMAVHNVEGLVGGGRGKPGPRSACREKTGQVSPQPMVKVSSTPVCSPGTSAACGHDRLVPGALDALSAALAGGRLIELEGSLARTSPAIWSCDGGRFQPRLDPQVMERCSSNHALSRCGAGRYVPASPAGGRLGHQATEADRTGIRWAASPASSSAFACG